MEAANHEITVAKAAVKKAPTQATAATMPKSKVIASQIVDLNINFFLLIQTFETGEIMAKYIPKSKAMSETWVALN